jgi:hypothetical protein
MTRISMLRIEIPTDEKSGTSFNKVIRYNIPAPPDGFQTEVNNNIILSFEDEQEAIDYAHQMDGYAEALNNHSSPEYKIAGEIIKAIGEDEFVQAYIQE